MKRNKYLAYIGSAIIASGLLFSACEKEDSLSGTSVLDTTPEDKTTLDLWLDEEFLDTYNINVIYRWDPYKSDLERYLTPPSVEKVQPALEVVKKIWLDTYSDIAGEMFVKRTAPREILLVGSQNMNPGGTVTLGLAEQGYRISLFMVDALQLNNEAAVKEYIHTIQHEYVHILNQAVNFNVSEYSDISKGGYRADWQNGGDQEAWSLGFISPYARSNAKEDFAEQTAWMLRDIVEYEAKVNAITNADGKAKIRQKEALVVEYYATAFGIDFYELCELARQNTLAIVGN